MADQPAAFPVAVSGSTGLIGSHLIPRLEARGHEVRRIVRPGSSAEDEAKRAIVLDRAAKTVDREMLAGVGAVVHLAGEPILGRWTDEKKKELRDSRVESTTMLAEAVAAMDPKPRALLCASAVGWYGDRGDTVLDESAPADDGFLGEICQAWEAACEPARAAGVRVVNMRIGVVLSPDGGALGQMLPPFKMGMGGPLGSGDQYVSWIGMPDIVAAIERCIDDDAIEGPVNLTSPNPVTNRELVKTLGHVLDRPAVVPLPAFAARLMFGKAADALFLASTRAVPKRLDEAGFEFSCPQLEPCLRELLDRPAE